MQHKNFHICLLLFYLTQGNTFSNSTSEQCTFSVLRYKYTSKAIFQYVPVAIINQTTLNIDVNVIFYRPVTPCHQSFVELQNLTINGVHSDHMHTNRKQLEQAILQIFHEASNSLQNTTNDIIYLNNYSNHSHQYRRITTVRMYDGQFIGNSVIANYVFNKLVPPTKTKCETIINMDEKQLEKSSCQSITASILTIKRKIHFLNKISNQTYSFKNENLTSINLQLTPRDNFDLLLKSSCNKNEFNIHLPVLTNLMNNDLSDQDLNDILSRNTDQYSNCEWAIINQSLIEVQRSQATEYIFKNFYYQDQSIIQRHLDIIEKTTNDDTKKILRKYFNNSCQIFNLIELRILIIISQDDLTMKCIRNRNTDRKYRAIAMRFINNKTNYEQDFRTILNNDNEPNEIRILAFQAISKTFNTSEINSLMQNVKSNQFRLYLKSLSKQSSLWLGHSGTYEFPFGRINLIFDETHRYYLPQMIQFELIYDTELDFYLIRNHEQNWEWEIMLVFDRKTVIRFSTMKDFFQWLNYNRVFKMKTLDNFHLQLDLKTDLNFQWLTGYFNQLNNIFKRSTAGVLLKIQHGLGDIMTGYQISFTVESNFKINAYQHDQSISYVWHSIQKENILFKIEQTIKPLVHDKQMESRTSFSSSSSSAKDFCYIIPHFDSKICLSFSFERLWPSSIAIRLLADDVSLIYNLTSSTNSIYFNIQQSHPTISRSYRLERKYIDHRWMPYYIEFSTPTTNYTSFINWSNHSMMSFSLLNNNRLFANGSGLYDYDSSKGLTINFTNIQPEHIGTIVFIYNGNLTISASRLLGNKLLLKIDRLSNWKCANIEIGIDRNFFFFHQNWLFNFYYNIYQSSFNMTLIKNHNSKFQWAFMKDNSHIQNKLLLNTSMIELDYHTQIEYENYTNLAFQSASLINGWYLWNVNCLIRNYEHVQIDVNKYSFNFYIANRTIQFQIESSNKRLLSTYLHKNQSDIIYMLIETLGYRYEINGRLVANYTNVFIDLPIIETILGKGKKPSHIHVEFLSHEKNLLLNLTGMFRNDYKLNSIQNLTFYNYTLYESNIQLSLLMIRMLDYPLLSFQSIIQYVPNSKIVHLWNSSMVLPLLFSSKPLIFHYSKDTQSLFVQIFDIANLTQTLTDYELLTNFGLQIFIINDLSTKIHLHVRLNFLGERCLLFFELDHNWFLSLTINEKFRYEFISSPLDSQLLLKFIDVDTNTTQILPINYHTDNQTLIRIEILFSKIFSRFINDFIFDISLKNHSFRLLCHMPFFRREFFSLTWNRYLEKELFHFHGLIQTKFLRRTQFIDYEYNYNLASLRVWILKSTVKCFSMDPIEFSLNITNDYLWYGRWAVDFDIMLSNHRQLVQFNHKYHYTTNYLNLSFNASMINLHSDLNLNYYHWNNSIQGRFSQNQLKHYIDGHWNDSENKLYLNTEQMKSITTIIPTFIKSIIDIDNLTVGVFIERTLDSPTNDSQIKECNPYLIIQTRPRLLVLQYYTLNDNLSTMMLEWSRFSYLSWNLTGQTRRLIPVTKFEMDIRNKYIFHLHTTTFKFSMVYNKNKRQLNIRRIPIADDSDDRYIFNMRYYHNRTFLMHLQVLNNHYEIIGDSMDEDFYWKLHGYFQHDKFNGSLIVSDTDWWLSSQLNFNSSLYIATGQYVQVVSTSKPQLAFEFLLKTRFHLALQYGGIKSLIVFKFFHNTSNMNVYFSSKPVNRTMLNINFQLNNQINQNWMLALTEQNFDLHNDNNEFHFHGSLQDFTFLHFIKDRTTKFSIDEHQVEFCTNNFGIIVSNLSSNTTKSLHMYEMKTKQNLTIHYYKTGKFHMQGYNIQTPIYDINIIYHSNNSKDHYVKLLLELLPLPVYSFSFTRGRSFVIGYETKQKRLVLSGNIAFTVENIYERDIFIMNEAWKLYYGNGKRDRFNIKCNIKIDRNKQTLHGHMNVYDPNHDMSTPIRADIDARLNNMMLETMIRVNYSATEFQPSKPVILQLNIDKRIQVQQYIFIKLLHEPSNTNLSLTLDNYPRRKLLIHLKPNNYTDEKTFIHLYANTTESQLNLIFKLVDFANLNVTLPKSYPETGQLYSSWFIDNEEYFHGRLEPTILKMRFKNYTFQVKMNQLLLQQKYPEQILASIFARWIERNSTTALINMFSKTDLHQRVIPIWQSAQQKTWLQRFQNFVFENKLACEFFQDIRHHLNYIKADFTAHHEDLAMKLMNRFDLDEQFKLYLQRINQTANAFAEFLFQTGFHAEHFLQDYLNNLTCLVNHKNLLHLDACQLVTLLSDTFIFNIVHHVNKTILMANRLSQYPRSINAIISYITNNVILHTYKLINHFYLETKKFHLSKLIQFTDEIERHLENPPTVLDSVTYVSSDDIRAVIRIFNDQLRKLLTLWMNSPVEHKIMTTIATQYSELVERFRFRIDDKIDFLLPTLYIYMPPLGKHIIKDNQTFLLTWAKKYHLNDTIDFQ